MLGFHLNIDEISKINSKSLCKTYVKKAIFSL
jgi:hypothetical protein